MGKKWTPEQRKVASERAKQRYQESLAHSDEQPKQTESTQVAQSDQAPQLLTFTPEQLQQLVNALSAGRTDQAQAPAFGGGNQTNIHGQVVGTIVKHPIDEGYYPDPVDELTEFMVSNKRTRRFGFRENYYMTWNWDAKPYETKFGTNVQEPTFHVTLYANQYDESGEETGKYIVIQSFHFNEDESTALSIAHELGFDANHENMRHVLDQARTERVRRWLLSIFFPENNFGLNEQSTEEAIGGSVVKVVTKSNVQGFGNKTPKIDFDELQ